jgi:hypothetical protein
MNVVMRQKQFSNGHVQLFHGFYKYLVGGYHREYKADHNP